MTMHSYKGISCLTSDGLSQAGVKHGFFLRHGGCSPEPWKSLNMATSVGDSRSNVIENRTRLAGILKIGNDRFYDVWQVHGSRTVICYQPRPAGQAHIQADAITTAAKDVYLLTLFADCVPIMVFDRAHKAVGMAHAGWKGTLDDVAGNLVRTMNTGFGTRPEDIQAVIGPCICQAHYEVGDEIAERAKGIFAEPIIIQQKGDSLHLDLAQANELNLRRQGVERIEQMNICTSCRNEDWFSHRAESGQTGRFAAVIGLPG